ncbi:short-chain dehydrogenases/reductase [Irpex lacteus]|nr:short-chain dehydrogenases/reductase [Irpex lacteus]
MPSYVVTGTSRGLGLGFVQALSADSANIVFAIVRSRSSASQLVEFVAQHPHKNSAADVVAKATGGTLDVLINNSALMVHERASLTLDAFPSPEILDEDLTLYFKTNVVGPIHTTNAFLPLLRAGKGKKVLTISTTLGSPKITNSSNFADFAGYSISKAGLNLAMAKFAARFRDEGMVFLTVSPGLVKTIPGPKEEVEALYEILTARNRAANPNFEGAITIEQSVGDILALLDKATIAESGTFVNRDGKDADYF